MNYTINKNTPLVIDVNIVVNQGSNGAWKVQSGQLVHDNTRESYIDKLYPFLEVGKSYRFTYTALWTSCNFKIYAGDTPGITRNSSGTFVENVVFTGVTKRVRFWSNGNVTITSIKIEELTVVNNETLLDTTDPNNVENKSFTLSYYPLAKQFVSYHSYLPNNYIIHPKSLLAKRNDTQIKQINTGDYGKYFDTDIKDFIIETIFNEYPLSTKVFDNLTVNLKSELNKISTNKFFDSLVLSTEYQCSGTITLDMTNLTKKERNWNINKFNDLTNNTNNPLFTSDWVDIKTKYPIDHVVNNNKIALDKPWYQRARFRDKFMKVRFIENNLENNKIVCNFVSTVYRPSQR